MVPVDGTSAQQQSSQGGLAPSMSRQPMAPGHHGVPSPAMPPQHHGQSMNAGYYPNIHRQHSSGIPGQPNFSIPPSPSSRQNSFNGMPSGGVHYQNHTQSSHHPMRSPAVHQQQGHHSMTQMHAQPAQASHAHQSHPQHMGMGSGPSQHPNMGSGAMQDSRQRSYVAAGMNGNWQSDKDTQHRREMIQQMYVFSQSDVLLQCAFVLLIPSTSVLNCSRKTKTDRRAEWVKKLPQMAKQFDNGSGTSF